VLVTTISAYTSVFQIFNDYREKGCTLCFLQFLLVHTFAYMTIFSSLLGSVRNLLIQWR